MSPRPYDRTSYDGNVVDWLTRAALEHTAGRLGYSLTVTQGSYNAGGVAASAGTHDGGGVVDLAPYDHKRKVRELRRTGFAAWFRPEIPGLWPPHIHAVLMGNARLHPSARAQVAEYLAGYDGLAGDGRDNGPREFVRNRFSWQTGAGRVNRARALIDRAQVVLSTGIRGYGVGESRRALGKARKSLPRVPLHTANRKEPVK